MKKMLYQSIATLGIVLILVISIFTGCHKKDVQLPEQIEEGKRIETQSIVGGQEIQISARPYQVLLRGIKPGLVRRGGGVILSPEWILTAAHLFEDNSFQYSVRAGATNVEEGAGFAGQEISVAEIIKHPDYVGTLTNPFNDIALVRLVSPLIIDANCRPIYYIYPEQLSYQESGNIATASGWGETTSGNTSYSQLQSVGMEIISPTNPYFVNFPFFLRTNSELYARRTGTSRQSVGAGDSGGPLTVDIPNFGDVLIGIVARGMPGNSDGWIFPSTADGPSAFTKVSDYLSWIRNVTGIYRPSIQGQSEFCNSATYLINNLGGANVNWSATPSGIVGLSVNGSNVELTRISDGQVKLTATISFPGSANNLELYNWYKVGSFTPTSITNFPNNGMSFGGGGEYVFSSTGTDWWVGGGIIIDGQGTNRITVRVNTNNTNLSKSLTVKVRDVSCGTTTAYFMRSGTVPPGSTGPL
ncbi:serine protease [Niabella sp. CJ426]|uniref:serine protease n=1 Tax=Niabella sp. CJ426 TaxID=3393740 RepID=UPI003D0096E7